DYDCCLRQDLFELGMVGDDEVQTESPSLIRLSKTADPAVHRDNYFDPGVGDLADGAAIEAVAFFEPMGNIEIGLGAEQVERRPQDRGARSAVHIVVAVNANASAPMNGIQDYVGGFPNSGKHRRRMQAVQRCLEKKTGRI